MANIIHISDFFDERLDVYARMSESHLLSEGIFIAESPIVIERALDSGYEPISILVEDKHIGTKAKDIIERCGDIDVFTADFDTLTKLTGFALTRGMLCAMKRKTLCSIKELVERKEDEVPRRIAILEDVVNPTNVGAIFRSAAALGMDMVLLTSNCSNPLYRRSIRVSMGNVFGVPWMIMNEDEWPQAISYLRTLGYVTVAMALEDDSVSVDDKVLKNRDKMVIVLGTEGEGLRKDTIESCDYTVKIPMSHGVDSLNVAAASAVVFWELSK